MMVAAKHTPTWQWRKTQDGHRICLKLVPTNTSHDHPTRLDNAIIGIVSEGGFVVSYKFGTPEQLDLLASAPDMAAEIDRLKELEELYDELQTEHQCSIANNVRLTARVERLRGLLMATSGPKSLMSDALKNQLRTILAETEPEVKE